MSIPATTSAKAGWLLQVAPAFLDRVDVYEVTRGEAGSPQVLRHMVSGDAVPWSEVAVHTPQHIFPISRDCNKNCDLYVRILTSTSLQFVPTLMPMDKALPQLAAFDLLHGIYTGSLAFAFLFGMLGLFIVRKSYYAYYAGYILFLGLQDGTLNGTLILALGEIYQKLSGVLTGVAVLGPPLLAILFIRSFLNLPARHPTTSRMFEGIAAVIFGAMVGTLAGFYPVIAPAAHLLLLAAAAYVLGALCILSWRRLPGALPLLTAFAFPAFVGVLHILVAMGLLERSGFIVSLTLFSPLSQLFLLGAALLARIRRAEQRRKLADRRALRLLRESESMANRLVEKRTQELEEALAHLRVSLEEERRTRESLSGFVDLVAHEYRTPVAVIRNSIDVVASLMEPAAPRVKRAVERIGRNTQRLVDILESALQEQLGMVPGGLRRESVPLLQAVRNAVDDIQERWPGVHFVVTPKVPEGARVWTDSFALKTILFNLLDNAAKYGPTPGPVEVDISGGCGAPAEIRLRDHGPGIPAGERERVFERFYRCPQHADLGTGMGLGLALAARLARQLGGTLELSEPKTRGLAVTLTVPDLAEATSRSSARRPSQSGTEP